MLRDVRSVTVVRSSTLPPCGPPGAAARADSVARALERPAFVFSACRECCVSVGLVAGCGGGVSGGFLLHVYGFTDLRIDPPPSPSRGPAVRRPSTNQVVAGFLKLLIRGTSSHAKIGFSPRAPRLAVVAVNRTSRPPHPQPPSIMCIQRQGVTRIWPPLRR